MAEITAALVKELRGLTGAGMMDCKKALAENDGDVQTAVDWLRKKGLSAAARKSGRVAAEGLVGVFVDGKAGALVEVNSETDFVARNETFQDFVGTVAGLALATDGNVEALKSLAYPDTDRTVEEQLSHMISTIGENMTLRRAAVLKVETGIVASYVHNAQAPGLGKIGVLVAIESNAAAEGLQDMGRQLAMHVAAATPQAVSRDDLEPGALDRERTILTDQARESGKPEEIIEKMVEGRLRKFYQEVCLLEQTYVIDNESKISAILEQAGKDAGSPVSVRDFTRFTLGEGVEKKKEDFAAEVAAAVKSEDSKNPTQIV